jgi:hypothetical protein
VTETGANAQADTGPGAVAAGPGNVAGDGAGAGAPPQGAEGDWLLLRGAVKGRNKKYSQDGWAARRIGDGAGVLLAVADGHGSRAHFRSDLGARWAIEAFTACAGALAGDLVRRGGGEEHWPAVLSAARSLPQQIVHRWRDRVALHEYNSPAGGDWRAVRSGGPDPIPYGSTLAGAVIVGRLLLCWQLGDGDLVLAEESGEACTPLYQGPELGDEADSLCQPEAWRQMRVHWQRLPEDPSTAVLISTDGLSKSFTDHRGFLGFADGLRDRARDRGLSSVQDRLEDWLAHAARYSGDDSTLVGAFPSARYGTGPAGPESRAPAGPGQVPDRPPHGERPGGHPADHERHPSYLSQRRQQQELRPAFGEPGRGHGPVVDVPGGEDPTERPDAPDRPADPAAPAAATDPAGTGAGVGAGAGAGRAGSQAGAEHMELRGLPPGPAAPDDAAGGAAGGPAGSGSAGEAGPAGLGGPDASDEPRDPKNDPNDPNASEGRPS